MKFKLWLEEAEIEQMFQRINAFQPTSDIPSIGGGLSGLRELEDVAAVVAGKKPLAWVIATDEIRQKKGPLLDRLLQMAQQKGMAVQEIGDGELLVGQPERVRRMLQIHPEYSQLNRNNQVPPEMHHEIGRLLGYPEEAVTGFTQRKGEDWDRVRTVAVNLGKTWNK
jgi:hypothetical protein